MNHDMDVEKTDSILNEVLTERMKQPAPVKWLVRHWLQAESVIVVHGPSTVGKSFQVVDWGLCIAYKNEWKGEKVYNGTVAYCAGEGHHGLRGRIAAWRQVNGVTETGRLRPRPGIYPHPKRSSWIGAWPMASATMSSGRWRT